jgi:hypothetical protein
MQPVIVAVQNAVSPREMGVATSSVTFFRQMGGTIGTAAFLSIMFTRLGTEIPDQIRQAAAASPEAARQAQALLQAGPESVLADTTGINAFPALVPPFRVGFSNTLDLVFLVAAAVVAIGFFVLLFLPQLELRNQSGIQAAAAQAAGDGAAADTPAETSAKAVGAAAPTSVPPGSAPAGGDGAWDDGTAAASDGAGRAPGSDGVGRSPGPRHQAADGKPTGLASIPADHLPDTVERGRP